MKRCMHHTSSIWRLLRFSSAVAFAGEMTPLRGREAIADLLNIPIARYPHDILLDRIWGLRNTMTAYDAAFVALAESLPATLVTCDAKLAATRGRRALIVLISKSV